MGVTTLSPCRQQLITIVFHEEDLWITLPQTNIAPKNGWLEYYFPIGEAYFQVRTVSFREGKKNFPGFFLIAWVEKTSQDVGYNSTGNLHFLEKPFSRQVGVGFTRVKVEGTTPKRLRRGYDHGNPSYPPQSYPPRNKALLRVINHWFPLRRPY